MPLIVCRSKGHPRMAIRIRHPDKERRCHGTGRTDDGAGNFITGGLLSFLSPLYLSVCLFLLQRDQLHIRGRVQWGGGGGIDRVFSLGCEEVYFVHSQKYSVHAEFTVLIRLIKIALITYFFGKRLGGMNKPKSMFNTLFLLAGTV
jgi:hypothetical protein